MERKILNQLDFNLMVSPPMVLVEHLLALARPGRAELLSHQARKLLNAGLADYALLRFNMPCMALAAMLMAYASIDQSEDDLIQCIAEINFSGQLDSLAEVCTCCTALQGALDAVGADEQFTAAPSPTSVVDIGGVGGFSISTHDLRPEPPLVEYRLVINCHGPFPLGLQLRQTPDGHVKVAGFGSGLCGQWFISGPGSSLLQVSGCV